MSDDLSGVRRPNFSQRYGHEPYPPPLQLNDLDDRTRTELWNFIYSHYLNVGIDRVGRAGIWTEFLARYRQDYNEQSLADALLEIVERKPYNQVLDLIEYLMQQTQRTPDYQILPERLNTLLAKNRVGYRLNFAEALMVPITTEQELQAIETAANSPLPEVQVHLRAAVQLFANRDNPQWAKSINESILAVEAAARDVAGKPKATLEKALDEIQRSGKADLHPTLIAGWGKLYAFAGDSGGIRHALKVGTLPPTQPMAQYFLVTCSAFVTLLASIA